MQRNGGSTERGWPGLQESLPDGWYVQDTYYGLRFGSAKYGYSNRMLRMCPFEVKEAYSWWRRQRDKRRREEQAIKTEKRVKQIIKDQHERHMARWRLGLT